MAVDPRTLAESFLRQARAQSVPAKTWLMSLNAKAVAAVAAGDVFVTATGFDGGNSTLERRFNAQQLLEVTEICLKTLEAEEAGEGNGAVRIADFGSRRSEWG